MLYTIRSIFVASLISSNFVSGLCFAQTRSDLNLYPLRNIRTAFDTLKVFEGEYIGLELTCETQSSADLTEVRQELRRQLRFADSKCGIQYGIASKRSAQVDVNSSEPYDTVNVRLLFHPNEIIEVESSNYQQGHLFGDLKGLPIGEYAVRVQSQHEVLCSIVVSASPDSLSEARASYESLQRMRQNTVVRRQDAESTLSFVRSLATDVLNRANGSLYRYESLDCALFFYCELTYNWDHEYDREFFTRMLQEYMSENRAAPYPVVAFFESGIGRHVTKGESRQILSSLAQHAGRYDVIERHVVELERRKNE